MHETEEFRQDYERVLVDAESLKAQYEEQETALQELQNELSEAESALSSALRELDTAKAQADEARQRTAEIERSKDQIIEGLSADLAHARDTHAALRESFHATDRHAKELENAARALEDEVRHLHAAHQDELSDLLVGKTDLQRKLDASYAKVAELDKAVNAGQSQIAQLQSECDQAKIRITHQNNVLKEKEEAYAECRAALSQSASRAKALQNELDATRHKALEKDQTLARLSSEHSQAVQQAKALQSELDAARQRLSAADEKDQESARLAKELADVREARNALTRKLTASNEQARRQQQAADEANRRRADESQQLRATHQAAVDELHGRHRSALQQQVKQSLQEIEKRDAELRTARSDLAAAHTAAAAARQQIDTLNTTLENHKHSAGALERTKEGMLTQVHADYKRQIAALVAEKEEMMHRYNVQVRELQAEQARLLLTARQRERVARGLAGVAGAALTTGIAYILF